MMSSKRRATSANWYQRHVSDHHVKTARSRGFRTRSALKLEQIDSRDKLLRPGMSVVDLGAAPGGWCQYLAAKLGNGTVIGVDLLEVEPVAGVRFVKGDILETDVREQVCSLLGAAGADLVVSDMAADITGVADTDQARMERLFESVLDFCAVALKPGGSLLFKAFEGPSANNVREMAMQIFKSTQSRKPDASRANSREFYLLCRNFNAGHKV